MNGNGDTLDDILAMVLFGVLDPKYLTGKDKPAEKTGEKDQRPGDPGKKEKKT